MSIGVNSYDCTYDFRTHEYSNKPGLDADYRSIAEITRDFHYFSRGGRLSQAEYYYYYYTYR